MIFGKYLVSDDELVSPPKRALESRPDPVEGRGRGGSLLRDEAGLGDKAPEEGFPVDDAVFFLGPGFELAGFESISIAFESCDLECARGCADGLKDSVAPLAGFWVGERVGLLSDVVVTGGGMEIAGVELAAGGSIMLEIAGEALALNGVVAGRGGGVTVFGGGLKDALPWGAGAGFAVGTAGVETDELLSIADRIGS